MSAGLQAIQEHMAKYLTAQGVRTVTAWPGQERPSRSKPVAVISLRGCQNAPSGFQDYLGERYNQQTGLWEELYGRKAQITFGLDVYAPGDGEENALQEAFDKIATALAQGGPRDLAVQEFSCEETQYDSQTRLQRRSVQVACQAYLYAVAREGGEFLDFELRGGLKT